MHHFDTTPPYIADGLKRNASDWHLAEGEPIYVRANGKLRPTDYIATKEIILHLVNRPDGEKDLAAHLDGSFSAEGEFFRFNGFQSRGRLSLAIRHLSKRIRSLKDLGVPPKFAELLSRRSGLLLVTGPTGSGKSTSLTSAIDHINRTAEGVIITLEDPIEYIHENVSCIIRQRELGADFSTFPNAIRAAMRQDPDFLMVAEMRDQETIQAAITLAETGHLVLATLHSATASDAVTRILDAIEEADKSQVRSILSKSLLGVLSQQLLPALDGRQVGCYELMVNNQGISSLIREGRFGNIPSDISSGASFGMVSMDSSLESLVRGARISRDVALAHATDVKHLTGRLDRNGRF